MFANQFIVVDLANLIARAELVKSDFLSTKDGYPTGHVFRTFRSIVKLKRDVGGELIFALEGKKQKFRYELNPTYKQSRKEAREAKNSGETFDARPDVFEMISHMKCRTITHDNFEADDAIASFVAQNKKKTLILSPDKDLWPLLDYPYVKILAFDKIIDRTKVIESFRCQPRNVSMVKAILGDKDEVLKVPKLRWKQVEALFADPELRVTPEILFPWVQAHCNDATKALISEHQSQIETMFKVASIYENLELTEVRNAGNKQALIDFFMKFECKSLCDSVDLMT